MKICLKASNRIAWTNTTVHIKSALSDESRAELNALVEEFCQDYIAQHSETANKMT